MSRNVYLTFLKWIYTNRRTQVKKRVEKKNKQTVSKNIELFHKWTWLMLKLICIFSCLGFICAVVHRPRATPGTNPALRARVWGIFRRGPVPGVRGWGK